jgi:hypothetical protein
MTEAEWLTCTDSDKLLKKSRFRNYKRKCRLFATACCRCIWAQFIDDRSRHAVDVAERHADGLATDEELQTAACKAHEVHHAMFAVLGKVGSSIEWAAAYAADVNPIHAAKTVIWMVRWPRLYQEPLTPGTTEAPRLTPCTVRRRTGPLAILKGKWDVTPLHEPIPTGADHSVQCALIRDIFGNPFRPVVFFPEWRTDTALALARQMYESPEFSAMAILADALQDAGCDSPAILNHCRDTSLMHVRGCWVVDLVLGKQ